VNEICTKYTIHHVCIRAAQRNFTNSLCENEVHIGCTFCVHSLSIRKCLYALSPVHTERVAWRRVAFRIALMRVNAPENQSNLISTRRYATPRYALGVNGTLRVKLTAHM